MDSIKTDSNLPKEIPLKEKRFNAKNCLKISTVILVIWLAISIYFYNQHSYSLKTFTIDKQIKVGDSFFYLNKAKLQNITQTNRDFKLPKWQLNIAEQLPQSLVSPYLKILAFYSTPYEFNKDVGTLRISGVVYTEHQMQ